MRNTLRIQDLVQAIRFVTGVIPFARPDDDAHVIVFPRIGDVRQILVQAVEIDVLVVVAIKKSLISKAPLKLMRWLTASG